LSSALKKEGCLGRESQNDLGEDEKILPLFSADFKIFVPPNSFFRLKREFVDGL
jgi:hypothetical protein